MLITWVVGLLSIVPDLAAFVQSNSIVILTDVLRTASDTVSIFLSWLVVRSVARGKTEEYNYGYGKLENLASLGVAAALFVSFFFVVIIATKRIFLHHPDEAIQRIQLGLIVHSVSAVWNGWLWRKHGLFARMQHSPISESQWRIFRAKTAINVCVLMTLLASKGAEHLAAHHVSFITWGGIHWGNLIDPSASFVLAAFLLFSAVRVVSVSVYDLLDHSLEESMQVLIRRGLAAFQDRYLSLCGIRSRRSGGYIYIEVFLEFEGSLPMHVVQHSIDDIRQTLESEIANSQIIIVPATCPIECGMPSRSVSMECTEHKAKCTM